MKLGGKDKSLEEQLAEIKKKEAEMLKKIEEEKEAKRKQEELDAQLEKERKLLEEKEAHEEHLRREAEKVKELERQQQEKAKQKAIKEKKKQEIEKAKETLKAHPDGCFCADCAKIRDDEKLLEGNAVSVEEVGVQEPKAERKMPKFKKPSFGGFKLPKRKPKKEVLTKKDLGEYHKVKKNPNALVSFINSQKTKLNKSKEFEKKPVEGAIDTNVQPSIFTDLTVLGLRLAIGISFIVHGLSKMNEGGLEFGAMLQNWGLPPELSLPIAYIEMLAGLFITVGILSRIASIVIGVIMLGAIFLVKGASTLIGVGGVELDVIILASVALLGIFGPGKFSLANIGIKGMIFDRKLQ